MSEKSPNRDGDLEPAAWEYSGFGVTSVHKERQRTPSWDVEEPLVRLSDVIELMESFFKYRIQYGAPGDPHGPVVSWDEIEETIEELRDITQNVGME